MTTDNKLFSINNNIIKNQIYKDDICCIIITFNPNDELIKLLNIIDTQVSKIIIVDNFSEKENFKIIRNLIQYKKIQLIKNNSNYGIAKALNQGVLFAKQLGYDWAITFDQDTIPFNDIVKTLIDTYYEIPNKNIIGAIGVNSVDINNNLYYNIKAKTNYSIKKYLITSGTLLSLNVFFEIGGFSEDLFIDNVDIDYSLRINLIGKHSYITHKCGMLHKPGNSISKKIFGIELESSNHNALRKYYMSRNNFILTKKFIFQEPYFIIKMNFFYIISLLKTIIIEKNRKNKIRCIMKGIFDGVLYKVNQQA